MGETTLNSVKVTQTFVPYPLVISTEGHLVTVVEKSELVLKSEISPLRSR